MARENTFHARKLTLGGAVLAAIAASSCCIGPLLLAAVGVGGAGAFAALSAFRPYILAVTVALLAGGFYLTYRRPRASVGDACGCERPRAGRAGRVGLWIATVIVVLFAASPTLIAKYYDFSSRAAVTSAKTATAVIVVDGADCAACAAHLKSALTKVGGLRDLTLDVSTQTVTVAYEPAPGRLDAYVAAINDLGYEARLPSRAAGAH